MARERTSTQRDLFEEPPPRPALAPSDRAKALEQLRALLTEAASSVMSEGETGDDEDHA